MRPGQCRCWWLAAFWEGLRLLSVFLSFSEYLSAPGRWLLLGSAATDLSKGRAPRCPGMLVSDGEVVGLS